MLLTLDVLEPEALPQLRAGSRRAPAGRGEVAVRLRTGGGARAVCCLGRDFQLDGELAERLASVEGLANVQLATQRGPNLRLVA